MFINKLPSIVVWVPGQELAFWVPVVPPLDFHRQVENWAGGSDWRELRFPYCHL